MSGRTNGVLPLMILVLLLSIVGLRTVKAADPAAGQAVFRAQCSICHSVQAGRNMIGPSLFGVVGRKTGAEAGFHYSTANQNANLTWTPDVLDKYLLSPRAVVPGTKMTFAGQKDATKRADLIAYLETLK
jgi:cytochrome c